MMLTACFSALGLCCTRCNDALKQAGSQRRHAGRSVMGLGKNFLAQVKHVEESTAKFYTPPVLPLGRIQSAESKAAAQGAPKASMQQ